MRTELVKSLEEITTKEQLATILQTAASESDEVDFLRRVLANLMRQNKKDGALPDGYAIVPKQYREEDPRTNEPIADEQGQPVVTQVGWAIQRTNGRGVEFCGSMGEWKRNIANVVAWQERDAAIAYANFWQSTQDARRRPAETAVDRREMSMPYIDADKPERGAKVNFQLTVEQTRKLDGYVKGARAANAEIEGTPVKSRVDVIRMWLEK